MYKQKIAQLLTDVLHDLGMSDVHVQVDYPADKTHGDYASNIAMVLFSNNELRIKNKGWKSPRDVAQEIATILNSQLSTLNFLEKVEVAGPGFINFTLSEKALIEGLEDPSQKLRMTSPVFKAKKVMVEYTDPNPFKEFHVGHLYTNIIGESLSRLLEAAGAEVQRVCYQGDVGLHVAKAIFGLRQKLRSQNAELRTIGELPLVERAKFLGEAYALGASKFEEDEHIKHEIIEINKKVYAKDPEIMELYEKGRAWSLDYFELIYKRLGTKFNHYYFESQVGEYGLNLVREYLAKGVFEESQGAVIFPGEKYGLHSRVFINSLGLPTYEAKELGLAPLKYKDFAYDQSIIVTGNEINEYFKVLIKALEQINPELAQKTKHLSHGMVRLPEGKMSSRTGKVLSGEWLLNEAQKEALKKIEESSIMNQESGEEKEVLADQIGKAAIKWALLRSGIGKDVEFSFSESISFEGNSGPYLQYTYARTQSVLAKSQNAERRTQNEFGNLKFDIGDLTLNSEELAVLRHLVTFDEIVLMAAESYSPNTVSTYLYELAQKFNNFYQKHKILSSVILSDNEESSTDTQQVAGRSFADAHDPRLPRRDDMEITTNTSQFRLALTKRVGKVIKEGLYLLGIEAPERM